MANPLMHYKVCDEITYPFLDFNGTTIEIWEWENNFTCYWACDYFTMLG